MPSLLNPFWNARTLTLFTGVYAPPNWTQVAEGDSSINTSGAPISIALTSSDDDSGVAVADFTIAAPSAGTVSFNWSYVTTDENPGFDPFGYLLNGNFTQLTRNTSDGGTISQSGTTSFSVASGNTFGFRQSSADSLGGRATTTINNFNGPVA